MMNKILPAFKYLLKNSYSIILIGFANVIFNAAVIDAIFFITARQNGYDYLTTKPTLTMTFEYTSAIYTFVICIILFVTYFKTLVANGVSRRSIFMAYIPVILVMSIIFALWNILVMLTHWPFVDVILASQLIYPNNNLGSLLLYPTLLCFFTGVLGWLITLAYYRATNLVRWIISLAPFTLLGIFIVLNINAKGLLSSRLLLGNKVLMGTASNPHNPFIAALSLGSMSVILLAIIYLMLRRAPLRD
jgi:hypothetical protein